MPYIKDDDKEKFELLNRDEEIHVDWLNEMVNLGQKCKNSGELNFAISELVVGYMVEHGLKYKNMNDVVGALCGALTEFNRRIVAPYEDLKIEENGDTSYSVLLEQLEKLK
ncbi:MAG: DUF6899 family protein [Candidatus Thorarchaeota archaeon]|jgi:hypothetical protein